MGVGVSSEKSHNRSAHPYCVGTSSINTCCCTRRVEYSSFCKLLKYPSSSCIVLECDTIRTGNNCLSSLSEMVPVVRLVLHQRPLRYILRRARRRSKVLMSVTAPVMNGVLRINSLWFECKSAGPEKIVATRDSLPVCRSSE